MADNTFSQGKYLMPVKVGADGQIVIDAKIRELLSICPGDTLLLIVDPAKDIAPSAPVQNSDARPNNEQQQDGMSTDFDFDEVEKFMERVQKSVIDTFTAYEIYNRPINKKEELKGYYGENYSDAFFM